MKWKIVDTERDEFVKKQLLNPRKGGGAVRLDSSGPSSPALGHQPTQASERLQNAIGQGDIFTKQEQHAHARVKSPPRSATPPLTSYPMANESYTPDRGPRPNHPFGNFKQSPSQTQDIKFATPAKRLFQDDHPKGSAPFHQSSEVLESRQIDEQTSSPNVKPNVAGLRDHSANSPPTLYSDPATHNANGASRGLVTPLVSRHAPRLAPPSTAQVPSQYMNFSSPAPFWKYVDLPSTPAKQPLDLSPIKLKQEGEDIKEDIQPSSPPMIRDDSQEREDQDENSIEKEEEEDMTPESPTRTVSRPASRAHLPAPGSQRSRSNSNVNSFVANGGMVRGTSLSAFDEAEEEGGFDLAKGFQKIGSFHRNMAQAHIGHSSQQSQTGVRTNT